MVPNGRSSRRSIEVLTKTTTVSSREMSRQSGSSSSSSSASPSGGVGAGGGEGRIAVTEEMLGILGTDAAPLSGALVELGLAWRLKGSSVKQEAFAS